MNFYGPEHGDGGRPKSGTGLKIWQALESAGYEILDLHYNANCWGQGFNDGWGTWACHVVYSGNHLECWCGWDSESGQAYFEQVTAPFTRVEISARMAQGE